MTSRGRTPLRVLSVVTLVSPTGEYGGPVRVAVNQAQALQNMGHMVTLAGGARGTDDGSAEQAGGVHTALFPVRRLVPRTGFSGIGSPGLWRWMRRHIRNYDVVHVHAARDFVTLPSAAIARHAGVPYVVQTHGMIDPSSRWLARPLDATLTRPLLRHARRVLYLTEEERRGLEQVTGPGLRLEHVPNGVPLADQRVSGERRRVLYLARLAQRKRPMAFVEAAQMVAQEHPTVEFLLVGPDEGEGPQVAAAAQEARGRGVDISWIGPLPPEQTGSQMQLASVYVLPSVDEPFPMSVLEAMAAGVPVVITRSCGLADMVVRSGAGLVVDETLPALADAVGRMLADPFAADEMGRRGRAFVGEHMTMGAIARQLESIYSG